MTTKADAEIMSLKRALQHQIERSSSLDKDLRAAKVRIAALERALGSPECAAAEAAHWQYLWADVRGQLDRARAGSLAGCLEQAVNPLAMGKDAEARFQEEALSG